ncbi:MAG: hypothetical protein SF053_13110 [Bacteroidia bacterium]|nr:hypothetical protein [Bacteroidia bacterium]
MLIQVKKLLNTYPISHIIATGAPFKPFYYLTALRSDFPEVKILLDYRDPWTNAINYGMSSLSRGRLQYELDIEKKAIQNADVIMSPTDPFIQIPEAIKSALPKTKIVELPHAYDQDDLPAIQAQAPQDNIIRIIYTGTLYEGLKPLLTAWADALLNLQQQDSQLYERIRIDFYTNETKTGLDFKEKHPEIISLNKTVPVKEMYQKISEASICLLFSLPHIRHYKTTKFFEYLTLSKPFLLLGDKGNVSQFLDDEKIGQSLDIQDLQNGLLNSTIYTILDPRHIQTKYDHSRFSFDYVTDQLITLLT